MGDASYWFAVDGVLPALDASRKPTVQDKDVVLTYSEPLDEDSAPALSAFAVTIQGEPASVTALALANTVSSDDRRYGKVTLQLASPVAAGVEVTVNYAVPASDPIRDLAGNKAAAFANVSVTNNSKPPLTAAFEDMPGSHDGETEFAFRVRFSEGIRNPISTMRNKAFDVTGGSVVKASRVNGDKKYWEITIQPDGERRRGDRAGAEPGMRLRPLHPRPPTPVQATGGDGQGPADGKVRGHAGVTRRIDGVRVPGALQRGHPQSHRVDAEDRAFDVTGGSVVKARRVNGDKKYWEITIQPDGDDAVVIVLAANRGCNSGPCTQDRRRLAKRLEETVEGPPAGKRLSPVVESTRTPDGYALGAAYPNPFNPEITIEFSVPRDGPVKIEVFNAAGQRLSSLVDEALRAGTYKTVWDGLDPNGMQVSSGIYLYRMQAGDFVATRSMTLLK